MIFRVLFLTLGVAVGLMGCAQQGGVLDDEERRASDESPNADPAYINAQLGIGYLSQGKYQLAMIKLDKALRANPNLAIAHGGIALLYERLGKDSLAGGHYEKAADLAPNDPYAQNNYGTFLCKQNKLNEADARFLKALQNSLYTTPEVAYTNAALCALKVPDHQKAENYLKEALNRNPKFPAALFQMAKLQHAQTHDPQARSYFKRYLEVADYSPEVLKLGIDIAKSLGDNNTASIYAKMLDMHYPDAEKSQ